MWPYSLHKTQIIKICSSYSNGKTITQALVIKGKKKCQSCHTTSILPQTLLTKISKNINITTNTTITKVQTTSNLSQRHIKLTYLYTSYMMHVWKKTLKRTRVIKNLPKINHTYYFIYLFIFLLNKSFISYIFIIIIIIFKHIIIIILICI